MSPLNFLSHQTRAVEIGFLLGRWSVAFACLMPVSAIVWVLAAPLLAGCLVCAIAALVLTRGRSKCGWTAFGLTLPFTVAAVWLVASMFAGPGSAAPAVMPNTSQSIRVYSMPNISQAARESVHVTGVFSNGDLQRLHVTDVVETGRLFYAFGLRPGDEIIKYGESEVRDTNDVKVATEWMIEETEHPFGQLTVWRDGEALLLIEGRPPIDLGKAKK